MRPTRKKLRPSTIARRDSVLEEIREFFRKEGKYLNMAHLCARLGYKPSTLTNWGLHTDDVALEFGFIRTGKKANAKPGENEAVEAYYLALYKEMIISTGRPVPPHRFIKAVGLSTSVLWRWGWNCELIHDSCSIAYHPRWKMCTTEQAESKLRELIEIHPGYVSADILAEALKVSRASIHKCVPRLTSINAEYERYPDHGIWEAFVGRSVRAFFPEDKFETQKKFKDLQRHPDGRGYLKYDFYCKRLNLLIEADGSHHTDPSNRGYSEDVVERDRMKTEYAKQKGIQLIRIPYTVGWNKQRVHHYLSGISSPETDGQPAAKPDESQEGSTTSRKT